MRTRGPGADPRVRRSSVRRVASALLLLVGAALLAFVGWLAIGDDADQVALDEAIATYDLSVEQHRDGTVTVGPGVPVPGAPGVVFLPGTRIEPAAYVATWAPIVASTGAVVHIPAVPLNLPALAGDPFTGLISADTERTWVVGGHSMGGFEAAGYAMSGEARPAALLLWGSGPGRSDLTDETIPTLLVTGGADTILPLDFALREGSLPRGASIEVVPGMAHGQFGRYSRTGDASTPGNRTNRTDAETLSDLVAVTTRFLEDVTGSRGG